MDASGPHVVTIDFLGMRRTEMVKAAIVLRTLVYFFGFTIAVLFAATQVERAQFEPDAAFMLFLMAPAVVLFTWLFKLQEARRVVYEVAKKTPLEVLALDWRPLLFSMVLLMSPWYLAANADARSYAWSTYALALVIMLAVNFIWIAKAQRMAHRRKLADTAYPVMAELEPFLGDFLQTAGIDHKGGSPYRSSFMETPENARKVRQTSRKNRAALISGLLLAGLIFLIMLGLLRRAGLWPDENSFLIVPVAIGTALGALLAAGYAIERVWPTAFDTTPDAPKRMAVPSADDALRQDARAPVLYLRPFEADIAHRAIEHEVCTFATLGPIVAIGDPRDPLPSFGAYRKYVKGEGWQAEVESLIARSSAIVIVPGPSEGVGWELERALRDESRHKLIAVFPFHEPERVRVERWRSLVGAMPPPLKAKLSGIATPENIALAHFFYPGRITLITNGTSMWRNISSLNFAMAQFRDAGEKAAKRHA